MTLLVLGCDLEWPFVNVSCTDGVGEHGLIIREYKGIVSGACFTHVQITTTLW